MISPADMILFAAVVREGSFTGAARHLGITKQTASERIAKLEMQLGVRLLERTTRRLRATDAGAHYAEKCSAIAAQVEDANREVQQRQSEPSGVLRVSTPVLYGRRYLAPVVASFLSRYPRVRVELVLADRRVELVEEGFDIAIRIGKLQDSTLAVHKLGVGYVYFVASPRYLSTHGHPQRDTMAQARFVGTRRIEQWELLGVRTRIEPTLVVNDLEVACEAAVAGVGITRVPGLVCRPAVERGELEVLFGHDPALTTPVYAVFPSRTHLAAKVRLFVDALGELIEPMLPLPVTPPTAARGQRRPTSARSGARKAGVRRGR
ncbi:MAG: LysR family transcriptional regulator [Deltaproteobacteria bacterium]|nr:LysR family transcriptional regulator [Deltaproteobacteria bacterium]MBK8713997.1 LysR family transcriptional regulator [Deltaproteobacteria bacterium]MBP7291169.1 LysR family transcriptional regulator [Nannocystaceae bacterium]